MTVNVAASAAAPQAPSHPEKTSASKADLQAAASQLSATSDELDFDDPIEDTAEAKQRRLDRTALFQAYAGEHAAFGAYSLQGTDEGPERDDTKDEWRFEIVQGLFRQSDASVKRFSPEEMLVNGFGLVDESPERWSNFKRKIAELQSSAPPSVHYKVLYCGRHGQGWHNVSAERYDPLEWELDWARRNGDGVRTWGPDAELTSLGENQARQVFAGWKRQLADGAPKPQRWICSPLTRTADTMRLSFGDGELLKGEKRPVFTESIREIYGVHTCDKRRSKTFLAERFPDYDFEEGFSEEDPWWHPEKREMEGKRRQRMRRAMFDLWNETDDTYISITSHSCALRSLLAILNHAPISLETGEMIPVVVKATRKK